MISQFSGRMSLRESLTSLEFRRRPHGVRLEFLQPGPHTQEDVSKLEHAPRLVAEFARIPTIPNRRLNSCEFSDRACVPRNRIRSNPLKASVTFEAGFRLSTFIALFLGEGQQMAYPTYLVCSARSSRPDSRFVGLSPSVFKSLNLLRFDRTAGLSNVLRLCLLIGATAITTAAHAQEARPTPVAVTTIDEGVIEGRLTSLSDVVEIATDADTARRVERNGVISIRRTDPNISSAAPQSLVLLVNGDVLAGRTISVGEDTLQLEWTGTDPPSPLTVPLEFVRSIVLSQPTEQIARQRLQRLWGLAGAETDRLILLNGTYADGELSAVDGETIVLSTSLGAVNTPRGNVAAVTMNSQLAADMTPKGESAILLGIDGSRITLQNIRVDAEQVLTGQSAAGFEVELPLDRLVSLLLLGDRVVSLADRVPADYVFTPYLIERHPLVTNRNVYGGPLKLHGTTFATGLGVHSQCDVTYDLTDGEFRSFTATIGVDDLAEGQGHVVFTVAVDGKLVFDSGGLAGNAPPTHVGPIDVQGAKQLTLSVGFGRRGNIRDVADWCDPLLTK